ncbi:hypothetical protein IFM89_022904 [Coptis chinensis]|uniref:Uncharacterized protein n=1 Tax=Coptis chinensis TaxID=261450 RepID=A0A835I5K1_9MAGN|nr:hypothetical protein IFM89_022904 [Coptis chinensis]
MRSSQYQKQTKPKDSKIQQQQRQQTHMQKKEGLLVRRGVIKSEMFKGDGGGASVCRYGIKKLLILLENNNNGICPFQSIYQFGDSISDVGNLIRLGPAGARTSSSRFPYGETIRRPTGRSSNGLLMIDYIATALGLPRLNPYLDRTASVQQGLRRSLVFLGEVGGNDYNNAFFQHKPVEEIRSYVPQVVSGITNAVRQVIRAGAVRVVVPGNFPIGCIPIYLTSFPSDDPSAYDDTNCLRNLNEFAVYHNDYLRRALQPLRREYPRVVILYGDYYTAFQSVLHRAPLLGFDGTSLMKVCCGVGGLYNFNTNRMCGLPGVPVCPNPAQRIHWDGIHLTQEAYSHMSEWLLNDLLPQMQCA